MSGRGDLGPFFASELDVPAAVRGRDFAAQTEFRKQQFSDAERLFQMRVAGRDDRSIPIS